LPYADAMVRTSAGILLYRHRDDILEVLLVHPGGPFFARKDLGNWSIPKGEVDELDADMKATARREFAEEVGLPVPAGELTALGWVKQRSGKIVHAWAVEGDLDTSTMKSNDIELPWPPLSGRTRRWPEVDRHVYYGIPEARRRIKETQQPFLDRLEAALASPPVAHSD
jgi:predicted NUDIX family NTP pyrophosphohydrolase